MMAGEFDNVIPASSRRRVAMEQGSEVSGIGTRQGAISTLMPMGRRKAEGEPKKVSNTGFGSL